jgi:hypothetical protein
MTDLEERIKTIEEFKAKLQAWLKTRDPAQASKLREWLNQNAHRVRNETIEANTHAILTIFPPPAIAGSAPVMRVCDDSGSCCESRRIEFSEVTKRFSASSRLRDLNRSATNVPSA